ncbi:MAG: long-chain fatty acid--CoA ligase [Verrucomicrobia bacterium]|nr:long-chain fatty acid--CoA ligase [Verrucomicrobiota bacterium]MCH8512370.1 long-chain fatty acid--CoA ligase [Kiritimatiellia bacterium]
MKHDTHTLIDLARAAAARYPDHPAVLESDKTWTFSEVAAVSDRIAAGLAGKGFKPGDRIGLYCANSAAFALTHLGILKAGCTVVALHLLYHPNELAWILNDAEASGLIYLAPFEAGVDAIRPQVPGLREVIRIGGGARENETDWSALAACTGPVPDPKLNPAEDLAAILYTAGTTGKPKGAMLTHRNLVYNTCSTRDAMHLVPGQDRILVALPMFHAFAAMVGMLFPLCHGCTIIPVPKFDPVLVAETIKTHRATVLPAVPSMFNVLLRLPEEMTGHFDSLRFCISGGAAMPLEVMKKFTERFGKVIYEGDGPTECSPVTCVNPIGGETRPGSVGFPVPDVEMKILDESGNEVPDDEIGEICVRAPSVMKGYWKQPEETAASFFGDWFRTGDLGHKDADGYFYIVDRKKDMLIVNGMNVYPRVVEEILYQFPGIREAAVIGVQHKSHGEIPEAWIVLSEDISEDPAALRSFCLEHLGKHEVPRRFRFVKELPKNAAGKINKRELRKQGEHERGV